MASYNRIIMIGNLTRDPEYKQQQSGQGVCRLSIASNRQYKNKQSGATVQEVCYVDVDVWGAQAESCRQYLQKGKQILVEGRLKLDTWEADGQTKRRHSIVADRVIFLGSNQQGGDSDSDDASMGVGSTPSFSLPKKPKSSYDDSSSQSVYKDEPPFEDDLPF